MSSFFYSNPYLRICFQTFPKCELPKCELIAKKSLRFFSKTLQKASSAIPFVFIRRGEEFSPLPKKETENKKRKKRIKEFAQKNKKKKGKLVQKSNSVLVFL
ncbi:MAG: hypothetical protein J6P29_03455 [Acetobacter sp.]|nr:hypothetical protein [Acetobacter sp.]